MVKAVCHRCGREWDYTGQSDHYGTCPNCKTSVKLEGASEFAGRNPDPSERTEECGQSVKIEAGGEVREESVPEAIEALDASIIELYELVEGRSDSFGEIVVDVEEQEATIETLEDGLGELAGYFEELVEEAGGEVEYDNIETGGGVPDAVSNMEVGDAAVLGGAS